MVLSTLIPQVEAPIDDVARHVSFAQISCN